MNQTHHAITCPVCREHRFTNFNTHEICPACGWKNDSVMQMNPNHKNEAVNDLCLNDFIERFKKVRHRNPNYRYRRDGLPNDVE